MHKTMHKRVIAVVIAFVSMLCTFYVLGAATFATAEEQEEPHLSLNDFLSEMEITFDEYIAIMAAFEDDGIFPHYLEKNASRYEEFRKKNSGMSESTAIAYVNVNVDLPHYENVQEVPEQELSSVTILVNKHFSLPREWKEDSVAYVSSLGKEVNEEAANALIELREDLLSAGLQMHVRSVYRSYSSQASGYWNMGVAVYGQERADTQWARPGHSEHQTGLAADVLHQASTSLSGSRFETTEEFTWLNNNAHRFGFILRYPNGYEDMHGYDFEPWHWRYVGVDVASAMYDEGIVVYEEFYGKYLASDVLFRVKELIIEQRALAEAEEIARLEREAAEKAAAEEAAREAEAARLAQEAEALAAAEAAHRAAVQQAEEERARALLESEAAEKAARQEVILLSAITILLTAAIGFIGIRFYRNIGRRGNHKH